MKGVIRVYVLFDRFRRENGETAAPDLYGLLFRFAMSNLPQCFHLSPAPAVGVSPWRDAWPSLYKQSRPDNQHSSLLSEVLQFFYFLLLEASVPTSVATAMTSAISTTVSASLTSAMANTLTTAVTLTPSVSCCGLSMLSA
jgi:hypothetical protein